MHCGVNFGIAACVGLVYRCAQQSLEPDLACEHAAQHVACTSLRQPAVFWSSHEGVTMAERTIDACTMASIANAVGDHIACGCRPQAFRKESSATQLLQQRQGKHRSRLDQRPASQTSWNLHTLASARHVHKLGCAWGLA